MKFGNDPPVRRVHVAARWETIRYSACVCLSAKLFARTYPGEKFFRTAGTFVRPRCVSTHAHVRRIRAGPFRWKSRDFATSPQISLIVIVAICVLRHGQNHWRENAARREQLRGGTFYSAKKIDFPRSSGTRCLYDCLVPFTIPNTVQ